MSTVPTATIYEVYERTSAGVKCGTYGIGKGNKAWVELEAPYRKVLARLFPSTTILY
jgi:hypothetical protein